jgi:DNA-binding MarR family transcriptional regulator
VSDHQTPPGALPPALGRLRVSLQDAFLRASRQHGLTASQAELLCAAMAPAPVGRLAETLRCDRTNITHLAERAAQHGWILRQADPRDRRSSLIALTPHGTRLAQQFLATLEHQLSDLLDAWSTDRQHTAATLINEIATALDSSKRPSLGRPAAPEPAQPR